jgi:hypothetical protein
MDMALQTCTCVPRNLAATCEVDNLCTVNASTYDCGLATEAAANFCMP